MQNFLINNLQAERESGFGSRRFGKNESSQLEVFRAL